MLLPHFRKLFLVSALLWIVQPLAAEEPTVDYGKVTHKQVELYTPEFEGQRLQVSTFCLDPDQNFLIGSGGSRGGLLGALLGGNKTLPSQLTRISPDREVLAHVELAFVPTAINVAPNGDIFIAGAGNLVRFSKDFEQLASTKNPHIDDSEEYRAKKRAEIEAQVRQTAKQMAEMIRMLDKTVAELEGIEEEKRTPEQKARLASSKQAQQLMSVAGLSGAGSEAAIDSQIEATLNKAASMPSLAVTAKDVFLTISSGFGYEVWRLDHQFKNSKRIVRRVRGCCGQLDIQTDGEDLLVAENSRFRVVRYDRDGKKQNQFGSRDRTRQDGFGSCCNPMNLQCCANGDLLTAESSIGDIKRFSADGKLLSYIGKASIASGCKQVTLAHDSVRDRFYLYHKEKNALCVLIPTSEAPEFTEEELASKKAREGLGQKLVGSWRLEKEESVAGNPLIASLGMAIKAPRNLQFFADGRMDSDGGFGSLLQNNNPEGAEMEGYETQTGWLAKEQTGDNRLTIFATIDRVEQEELSIRFDSDDQATISGKVNGVEFYKASYKRAENE